MTDICSLGQEIYDRKYKNLYEPQANGKYAAIDLGTEQIQIADSLLMLQPILRGERPQQRIFILRIGSPALFTIG